MTEPRTILQEAHERLLARQETHGDAVNVWRRVAEAVSRRTAIPVTAEVALWVAVEAKLEHFRMSPEDPTHLRGALGYLAILSQLSALETAERSVAAWRARGTP